MSPNVLYTFLFGPNGLRVFQSTATTLSTTILGHSSGDEKPYAIATSSSLAALDRSMEINQSIQVVDSFPTIVESVLAYNLEDSSISEIQQCVTRLNSPDSNVGSISAPRCRSH